ncbi:hypothetical protein [Caldilinea sp.]|uniref:hypothetical protein n=1 Tax=Caldilinea sp. TaxID=2293560 RepID=UPI002CCA282B|nr:hypothetical protein [Anaerolineales bacterium]HQY89961.1 hypothetical protein [Caldilinea sp.]
MPLTLPEGWSYFADWRDLLLALGGLLAVALTIIWWGQQTRRWYRIAALSFLIAFILAFASIYLFWVPPYYAGCASGCMGWRGFPLPVARITFDGQTQIGLLDVLLNVLLLWLFVLVASLVGRIAAVIFGLENRSRRVRVIAVLVFVLAPWALLPRYLNPPQPVTTAEDLRLVTNARRAAETTYGITGLWVHRLALEDLRQLSPNPLGETTPDLTAIRSQVCLRGYTYFYIPWRRYRVSLEPTGVNALSITELPLNGSCWDETIN